MLSVLDGDDCCVSLSPWIRCTTPPQRDSSLSANMPWHVMSKGKVRSYYVWDDTIITGRNPIIDQSLNTLTDTNTHGGRVIMGEVFLQKSWLCFTPVPRTRTTRRTPTKKNNSNSIRSLTLAQRISGYCLYSVSLGAALTNASVWPFLKIDRLRNFWRIFCIFLKKMRLY